MKDTLFNKEDFDNIFGTPKIQIKPNPLVRNDVLEEVAKAVHGFKAFEKDTMDSFVAYIRSMKT